MSEIKRIREKLALLETPGIYELLQDAMVWCDDTFTSGDLIARELRLDYLKRLKQILPGNPKQTSIFDEKEDT